MQSPFTHCNWKTWFIKFWDKNDSISKTGASFKSKTTKKISPASLPCQHWITKVTFKAQIAPWQSFPSLLFQLRPTKPQTRCLFFSWNAPKQGSFPRLKKSSSLLQKMCDICQEWQNEEQTEFVPGDQQNKSLCYKDQSQVTCYTKYVISVLTKWRTNSIYPWWPTKQIHMLQGSKSR